MGSTTHGEDPSNEFTEQIHHDNPSVSDADLGVWVSSAALPHIQASIFKHLLAHRIWTQNCEAEQMGSVCNIYVYPWRSSATENVNCSAHQL